MTNYYAKTIGDRNEILFAQKINRLKAKIHREIFWPKVPRFFLYDACFSFRLSPRLINDHRILKLINNIHSLCNDIKSLFNIFRKNDFLLSYCPFSIFTDGGDFPRVIENALYCLCSCCINYQKMPSFLTIEERNRCLGNIVWSRLQGGWCHREVWCYQRTLCTLIKKGKEYVILKDRPRLFVPVWQTYKRTRKLLASSGTSKQFVLQSSRLKSECTVVRRLTSADMKACRPAVKPMPRSAQTQSARRHVRWKREQWASVLFSDEATFEVVQQVTTFDSKI